MEKVASKVVLLDNLKNIPTNTYIYKQIFLHITLAS